MSDNKRFEIRQAKDKWSYGYFNQLIDNETEDVVAEDGGESEDQTFDRDWNWVAPLLNELNDEIVRLKKELEVQQDASNIPR